MNMIRCIMNIGDNIVKIRIKNTTVFTHYYIGHIIPNHKVDIIGVNSKLKHQRDNPFKSKNIESLDNSKKEKFRNESEYKNVNELNKKDIIKDMEESKYSVSIENNFKFDENQVKSKLSEYDIYELPLIKLLGVNYDIDENNSVTTSKLTNFSPTEVYISVESKYNKTFSIDIDNIEFVKVDQKEIDKYKDYDMPFFVNKSI